ncbi:hypothetical protein QBC37DRAFT_445557 [Rhypophila decipiens]|uniref:Uncharacterized protein n=1 Tax=Rhypophila decipiens TaxID=261697 RepID=A0AAN6YKA2_9PEZI|nr:hypothetical protein QBC37DRAFT_445557 [Rhypophila decipiens]
MAFTMFNVLSLVFVLFSTFTHSYPIAAGLLLSERDEVVAEAHPSQSVIIAIAVPVAIGGVIFLLAIAYCIRKKLRAKQDRGKRVSGNSSGMTFEMDNIVPPPPPPHRSSPSRPPLRVPSPVAQPGPSGQRAGRVIGACPETTRFPVRPTRTRQTTLPPPPVLPTAEQGREGRPIVGPRSPRRRTTRRSSIPVRASGSVPLTRPKGTPQGSRSPRKGATPSSIPVRASASVPRAGRESSAGPSRRAPRTSQSQLPRPSQRSPARPQRTPQRAAQRTTRTTRSPAPPPVPPHRVFHPSPAARSNNSAFQASVESVIDESEAPQVPDHSPAQSNRSSFQASVETVSDEATAPTRQIIRCGITQS